MSKRLQSFIFVLFISLSVSALADESNKNPGFWEKRGYFGCNLGFIGTGKIRIDGSRDDTAPGFTFGAKFDFLLMKNLYWGIGCDIHRLYVEDTGQYFLDLTLTLKRMYFRLDSKVGFRPGIGIGFGHLANFRKVKPSTYLTVRTTLEVIFYEEARVAWFGEVGLMAAPTGGNKNHRMSFGPVPLIRIGAMF
jgi:hypothetical protein